MNRLFRICLFILGSLTQIHAQQISLQVYSGTDQKVVLGAVVQIHSLNDGIRQQIITSAEESASFQALLPVAVSVHHVSFELYTDTIEQSGQFKIYLFPKIEELGEVVVTGQYKPQRPDESVLQLRVIDDAEIRARAAINLKDLLEQEIHFRNSADPVLGSSTAIQGLGGQHIKILIDGVPVIGREDGNIDINQILLNRVERVEIVEGPMSVIYGTDALGGLINIITKRTSSYPVDISVQSYVESLGRLNVNAGLVLRAGKNSFSAEGGRNFFGGFAEPDTGRSLIWKPYRQFFINTGWNYAGKNLLHSLSVDYFDQLIQNKGVPVVTPYQAIAFDDYYATGRWTVRSSAEWKLSGESGFHFSNSLSRYSRIKNSYVKDMVSLEEELLEDEAMQDTTVFTALLFRATFQNSSLRQLPFQAGYDIQWEEGKGEKLNGNVQNVSDVAAFASVEFSGIRNLTIKPAVRAAINSRFNVPIIPSLHIRLAGENQWLLRTSYSRGFRSPSLKEMDIYFVDANHNITGNKNLKAETSHHAEFAFDKKYNGAQFAINLTGTAFYNSIQNIITLALTNSNTALYQYINIDEYETLGTRFHASIDLNNLQFHSAIAWLGYSNLLADSAGVPDYSYSPEFINRISFTFLKPEIEAALFFKNTGLTPGFSLDENNTVIQSWQEPVTLLDATVMKSFWQNRIQLTGGVKNIFNVVNVENTFTGSGIHSSSGNSIPFATGRFAFFSFQFQFVSE